MKALIFGLTMVSDILFFAAFRNPACGHQRSWGCYYIRAYIHIVLGTVITIYSEPSHRQDFLSGSAGLTNGGAEQN